MECPRCGFIEQRDVECPKCEGVFNAEDAEEWAHIDYVEAKLGEWRERGLLPEQKVNELLAVLDAELATVEGALGIQADGDSAIATRPNPRSGSSSAPDEDKTLGAVDSPLTSGGDTRLAERLLDSADQPPVERAEQFEPIDTYVGLDMLFLVTDKGDAPPDGEYFRRAIVYASSEGEACYRLGVYIDLCNAATNAQANDDEPAEPDEEQVETALEEHSAPIGYDRDQLIATLLATTTTRFDDVDSFDADHILIFETARDG